MTLDPRQPDPMWSLKSILKRAAQMAEAAELQTDQIAKAIEELEAQRRAE